MGVRSVILNPQAIPQNLSREKWQHIAELRMQKLNMNLFFLNMKKEEYKFRVLWVILKQREKILQYAR